MKPPFFAWFFALGLSLSLCVEAPGATPKFLNQKEASEAIVDDRADPYFSRLQPFEIGAKCLVKDSGKSLPQLQADARKTYAAESREFTPAEKEMLSWVAKEVDAMVEPEFPLVARTPWNFLKVSGKLEGGLPHTRGACIVLSEPVLATMLRYDQPEKRGFLRYILGKLILHEQIHVIQRLHPSLFPPLYTQVWGFRRAERLESHPWLIARNVVNPDGTDTGWVYPLKQENGKVQWIWPLLILNGAEGNTERMPQDFELVAIHVAETATGFKVQTKVDGSPDFQPIANTREYVAAFPTEYETYHPNEIAAEMIASYIAQQSMFPKGVAPRGEPALEKWATSIDWLKKNLR